MIKPEFIGGWIEQNRRKVEKEVKEELSAEQKYSEDEAEKLAKEIVDRVVSGLKRRPGNDALGYE